MDFVLDEAKKSEFDDKMAGRIQLASEEALVNIINYAYPEEEKNGEVEMKCISDGGYLEISLKDFGKEFNPFFGSKKMDPDASLEEREVGGLGIHLIFKVMDEVSYRRESEANIFTMIKKEADFSPSIIDIEDNEKAEETIS